MVVANRELAIQNEEKGKLASELIIANTELAYQNEEKEKRAAELVIANRELELQNEEKGKLASELIIANTELAYENEEKEKRAAELVIVNRELAFQIEEKGKHASELIIANTELAYQSEEKEKRAAELAIANRELAFQNDEKEKRAAELMLSNLELKKAENEIRELNETLEQRIAERTAELTEANKALEEFSYSVSHDLRSPLRTILGFIKVISKDYGAVMSDELKGLFGYIEASSTRMCTIIDDLLLLAKYGKEKLNIGEVDITALFRDVWQDLLFSSPHHAALDLQPIPLVRADSSMIRQVIVNLLSNAVKYSSKKENPLIVAGHILEKERIVIYIKDNGVGFDLQYYHRLFGAFQRLHGTSEYEGTGVGLMLVKSIVDRHGGQVWAEGKVDHGATFYFSLPLMPMAS